MAAKLSVSTRSRCSLSSHTTSQNEVVPARGDDDVRHLVELGDLLGDPIEPGEVDLEADEGRLLEAHRQRVGDADDLHDAPGDEPLRALSHRGFRHLELSPDLGIRPATVRLEAADDRLVEVIERRSLGAGQAAHCHGGASLG